MQAGDQNLIEVDAQNTYFAHSVSGKPIQEWHRLRDHLIRTAELAAEFAEPFGAQDWAYLAGLWHDLGKYSNEFQDYLRSQSEACAETQPGHIDHSTAGAQHAVHSIPIIGHLLAYAVAGHHAGLLDGRSEEACQEKRLKKTPLPWEHGLTELPPPAVPEVPAFVREALGRKDAFSVAFFVRMLFSCLVDADCLDTERAREPAKANQRSGFPMLGKLAPRFFQSLEKLESKDSGKPINRLRRAVRVGCEAAGEQPPGFFSLTVPTGGGKTLSSLAFALRHARRYDLRRIIYVVPFTTIIEQNAGEFRRYLGNGVVLEHHCSLDPKKETQASRLAAENWDAPLIVTTSVQFYDSLFANRTSQCRKLHRIARSVIILDEAQTIPVDYLQACLQALRELVRNYGCSVVLCTATQPEIRKRPDFAIGLEGVREIVSDPRRLYQALKRVRVENLGRQTDAELRERILKEDRVLCIVNTTRHARLLFEAIGLAAGHFHLSARMCPAHRRVRLWQIRRALREKRICRVISTQVVEAGVDLDFPVVFRALAGLDSIAQAAGRCNRNGDLAGHGATYVFTSEHASANRYFADTANCAAQVMELHPDPLDLEANEHFFKLYYWDQKARWDARHILDNFHLVQDRQFPFNFGFAKTASDFHLIDDAAYCTVIIPWGRKGRALCERLRAMPAPDRDTLRQAQRFMVQVRRHAWDVHAGRSIRLIYDNLGILESPDTHYSKDTGLNLDAEGPGIYFV
jgi:CRISPR-associated endonuclease/helicase Cas3